jgi:ATP-dependent Clp protease ATP-binding subunit ClpC
MWALFTEPARRVVYYAQEEAQNLGECYISTEHFLLGLLREENTLAAELLRRLGTDATTLRKAVMGHIRPGGPARKTEEMQITPRGARVINLARNEAEQLNNGYIGTEHLLLGLIREREGAAGRAFGKLGIELEKARSAVRMLQDAAPESSDPPIPPISGG